MERQVGAEVADEQLAQLDVVPQLGLGPGEKLVEGAMLGFGRPPLKTRGGVRADVLRERER